MNYYIIILCGVENLPQGMLCETPVYTGKMRLSPVSTGPVLLCRLRKNSDIMSPLNRKERAGKLF